MHDIPPWLGGVKALLVLTVVIVGFVTVCVWWMLTPSRVLRRAANEVHPFLGETYITVTRDTHIQVRGV